MTALFSGKRASRKRILIGTVTHSEVSKAGVSLFPFPGF